MDEQVQAMKQHDETGMGAQGGRRPTAAPIPEADTEVVVSTTKRRRMTKAYKLAVLERVAELKKSAPGTIGEYLRSEGLYYKTVSGWHRQQLEGDLCEHRKGTVGHVRETMAAENAKLKRQLAATTRKLQQAELLVELQKKISQLILADSKTESPE